ncbi:hypothetical protein LguiA_007354 [Lonicera macranthoides]
MLLEATNTGNPNPRLALIAFKPRQVILAEHNNSNTKKLKNKKKMKQSKVVLKAEQKTLLLHSVLRYIEKSGFSKTLKRFLSEAQIENDNWKASSLDLEDLFCEYSDKCNVDRNLNIYKEQELQTDGTSKIDGNINIAASEETIKKKKKKRGDESEVSKAVEDKFEDTDKKVSESAKSTEDISNDKISESKVKSKGNKKSKKSSDSPGEAEQAKSESLLGNTPDSEVEVKPKDKKKKNKQSNDSLVENGNPLEEKKVKSKDKKKGKKVGSVSEGEVVDQEEVPTKLEPVNESKDTIKKDKKSSKRKRLASDENKNDDPVKEEAIEEDPKRRKTEAVEEVKTEELTNGNLDNNGGDKSALQKSARKQNNGSAEPKSVNAFQRVKIDEVEFADEKLQDNSYWAKDGAEVGYGAKAQEILGQVRGRDFRHEKTKKKRGSYRGGQIDLNSHSIKFNYSDED